MGTEIVRLVLVPLVVLWIPQKKIRVGVSKKLVVRVLHSVGMKALVWCRKRARMMVLKVVCLKTVMARILLVLQNRVVEQPKVLLVPGNLRCRKMIILVVVRKRMMILLMSSIQL